MLNINAIQFWSLLTLLAINRMHILIDEAGYTDQIKCVATIYDSIYFTVAADPTIVEWLNNNLIEVMSKDFLIDQTVHNTAESEIGTDWNSLHAITVNAPISEITEVLSQL